MEWRVWITWWVIFCIICSRLFEYIVKKNKKFTDNSPVRLYLNETKNRITSIVKTRYNLEL